MSIKLYTGLGSGNAYKAELYLKLLALPYEAVSVSIPKGEHRDKAFLSLTPFGQIPVLVDSEKVFTDSHAILSYLARQYGGGSADQWLPTAPENLAMVIRWLSFSANEIQNGPTMARAAKLLRWSIDYDAAVTKSYRVLELMDSHLQSNDWLATGQTTIADIACYPYIFLAEEGGIDTRPFVALNDWMRRLEGIPGFWPMPRIPNVPEVPLVAYPGRKQQS